MKLNVLDWLAILLMIVGSLNWGLVGTFDFNIISAIFGATSITTRFIFLVVGLAAVYILAVFIPKITNNK